MFTMVASRTTISWARLMDGQHPPAAYGRGGPRRAFVPTRAPTEVWVMGFSPNETVSYGANLCPRPIETQPFR